MDILDIIIQEAAESGTSRVECCEGKDQTAVLVGGATSEYGAILYIIPTQTVANLNALLKNKDAADAITSFWHFIENYKFGQFEPC